MDSALSKSNSHPKWHNEQARTREGSQSYELLVSGGSSLRRKDTVDLTQHLLETQSKQWTRIAPYVAIGLQLAVVTILIIVIPVTIWIEFNSNVQKLIYTTGIALVSSILSTFVLSQIRHLWLLNLLDDHEMSDRRKHRAQTLLSIGSFNHQFRHYDISIALVVFGLMTSAIIGALTVTTGYHDYSAVNVLYTGGTAPFRIPDPALDIDDSSCWLRDPTQEGALGWTSTNGSFFGVNASATSDTGFPQLYCPAYIFQKVRSLWVDLDELILNEPDSSKEYGQGYVPPTGQCLSTLRGGVDCSAIGTLLQNNYCDSLEPWQCFPRATDVQLSACLPIFVDNPVTCRAANSTYSFDGRNITSVFSDSCRIDSVDSANSTGVRFGSLNSTFGAPQLLGVCTADRPIGEATILFAIKERSLLYPFKNAAAVECNISMADSLAFRTVTMTQDALQPGLSGGPSANGLYETGYYVNTSANSQCDPTPLQSAILWDNLTTYTPLTQISQMLTDHVLAAAAFSLVDHLNTSLDDAILVAFASPESLPPTKIGYPPPSNYTIQQVVAFPNSMNILEDYLGVTMASYMGYYWGAMGWVGLYGNWSDNTPMFRYDYNIPGQRVGPGSWWAILYILPAVCSLVVLVRLVWLTRWSEKMRSRVVS